MKPSSRETPIPKPLLVRLNDKVDHPHRWVFTTGCQTGELLFCSFQLTAF